MPFVACPSCGERGKIPPTLVGARIKCRKCGISFNVAGTAPKAGAVAGAGVAVAAEAATATAHAAGAAHEGIAVEGLDASAWAETGETSTEGLRTAPVHHHAPAEGDDAAHSFEAHHSTGHKEYKVICSRDKMFEGKFDVGRLEETLNQFARQGWVVKAMGHPHLKDFGGGTKEEVVVLLER
jgi:Domain of unknown function (DUF4177)